MGYVAVTPAIVRRSTASASPPTQSWSTLSPRMSFAPGRTAGLASLQSSGGETPSRSASTGPLGGGGGGPPPGIGIGCQLGLLAKSVEDPPNVNCVTPLPSG